MLWLVHCYFTCFYRILNVFCNHKLNKIINTTWIVIIIQDLSLCPAYGSFICAYSFVSGYCVIAYSWLVVWLTEPFCRWKTSWFLTPASHKCILVYLVVTWPWISVFGLENALVFGAYWKLACFLLVDILRIVPAWLWITIGFIVKHCLSHADLLFYFYFLWVVVGWRRCYFYSLVDLRPSWISNWLGSFIL
jgi:hypothetical protein